MQNPCPKGGFFWLSMKGLGIPAGCKMWNPGGPEIREAREHPKYWWCFCWILGKDMKYYPIWRLKKSTNFSWKSFVWGSADYRDKQPKMAGFRGFPMESILKKDRNFLTILGLIFVTPLAMLECWILWSVFFRGSFFSSKKTPWKPRKKWILEFEACPEMKMDTVGRDRSSHHGLWAWRGRVGIQVSNLMTWIYPR